MKGIVKRSDVTAKAVMVEMFGKKIPVVAVSEINGVKAVDAVMPVRCKDCVHWKRFSEDSGDCDWIEMITNEHWFCADGEEE